MAIALVIVGVCLLGVAGAAFRAHAAGHPAMCRSASQRDCLRTVEGWVTGHRTYLANGKRVYSVQVLAGTRASGWLTVEAAQYARLADDRAITVTLVDDRIERVR